MTYSQNCNLSSASLGDSSVPCGVTWDSLGCSQLLTVLGLARRWEKASLACLVPPCSSMWSLSGSGLGFLTARWFQGNQTLCRRKKWKLPVLLGPGLKSPGVNIISTTFCWSRSRGLSRLQGRRRRLHLLRGEWQAPTMLGEVVGGLIRGLASTITFLCPLAERNKASLLMSHP